MRTIVPLMAFVAVSGFAQQFQLGARIADFAVQDLSGKPVSYSNADGRVTVVAFISVNCPISNAFNDRLSGLYNEYSPKGVHFFILNANANERVEDVAAHARSAGFPFPVYKDTDNRVADRFGAMATPETYVIDASGVLRYHGYIDDAQNEARARNHALKSALDAVLAGKEVSQRETKAFGCTIKRVRRANGNT